MKIKITKENLPAYPKEFLDKYWHAWSKQATNRERAFIRQIKPMWSEQEKIVLSKMDKIKSILWYNKIKSVDDVLLPEKATISAWVKFEKPIIRSIIAQVGDDVFNRIGDAGFDTLNQRIEAYLANKTFTFGREVTRTTNRLLKGTLTEGIKEGESIPDLAKRVRDVFDASKGARSVTIARTETLGATNFGQHEAYQQSNLVKRKQWVSTRDDRVRTPPESEFDHLGADGETVDKDDVFQETGEDMRYPLDPRGDPANVINCRCTTIEIFTK